MGEVAYNLQLLFHFKIYNVFHASQLKRHVGEVVTLISIFKDGLNIREPKLFFNRMTIKRKKQSSNRSRYQMEAPIAQKCYLEVLL